MSGFASISGGFFGNFRGFTGGFRRILVGFALFLVTCLIALALLFWRPWSCFLGETAWFLVVILGGRSKGAFVFFLEGVLKYFLKT